MGLSAAVFLAMALSWPESPPRGQVLSSALSSPSSSLEQVGQLFFVPGVWAGQHGFSADLGKVQATQVRP